MCSKAVVLVGRWACFFALKKFQQIFTTKLSIWVTVRLKWQENMHCVSRWGRDIRVNKNMEYSISMILNGQHSVKCFCYAPMGMHFKIYSVPDPSSHLPGCFRWQINLNGDVSSPFLWCFGQWITMKLHYKAPQRQLSQGFTIFIDSYCVICKNYALLCRNLEIMQSDAIFDQIIMWDRTMALYQRPWVGSLKLHKH